MLHMQRETKQKKILKKHEKIMKKHEKSWKNHEKIGENIIKQFRRVSQPLQNVLGGVEKPFQLLLGTFWGDFSVFLVFCKPPGSCLAIAVQGSAFTWFFMIFHDFLCFFMILGYFWVLLCASMCFSALLDAPGCSWMLLDAPGRELLWLLWF